MSFLQAKTFSPKNTADMWTCPPKGQSLRAHKPKESGEKTQVDGWVEDEKRKGWYIAKVKKTRMVRRSSGQQAWATKEKDKVPDKKEERKLEEAQSSVDEAKLDKVEEQTEKQREAKAEHPTKISAWRQHTRQTFRPRNEDQDIVQECHPKKGLSACQGTAVENTQPVQLHTSRETGSSDTTTHEGVKSTCAIPSQTSMGAADPTNGGNTSPCPVPSLQTTTDATDGTTDGGVDSVSPTPSPQGHNVAELCPGPLAKVDVAAMEEMEDEMEQEIEQCINEYYKNKKKKKRAKRDGDGEQHRNRDFPSKGEDKQEECERIVEESKTEVQESKVENIDDHKIFKEHLEDQALLPKLCPNDEVVLTNHPSQPAQVLTVQKAPRHKPELPARTVELKERKVQDEKTDVEKDSCRNKKTKKEHNRWNQEEKRGKVEGNKEVRKGLNEREVEQQASERSRKVDEKLIEEHEIEVMPDSTPEASTSRSAVGQTITACGDEDTKTVSQKHCQSPDTYSELETSAHPCVVGDARPHPIPSAQDHVPQDLPQLPAIVEDCTEVVKEVKGESTGLGAWQPHLTEPILLDFCSSPEGLEEKAQEETHLTLVNKHSFCTSPEKHERPEENVMMHNVAMTGSQPWQPHLAEPTMFFPSPAEVESISKQERKEAVAMTSLSSEWEPHKEEPLMFSFSSKENGEGEKSLSACGPHMIKQDEANVFALFHPNIKENSPSSWEPHLAAAMNTFSFVFYSELETTLENEVKADEKSLPVSPWIPHLTEPIDDSFYFRAMAGMEKAEGMLEEMEDISLTPPTAGEEKEGCSAVHIQCSPQCSPVEDKDHEVTVEKSTLTVEAHLVSAEENKEAQAVGGEEQDMVEKEPEGQVGGKKRAIQKTRYEERKKDIAEKKAQLDQYEKALRLRKNRFRKWEAKNNEWLMAVEELEKQGKEAMSDIEKRERKFEEMLEERKDIGLTTHIAGEKKEQCSPQCSPNVYQKHPSRTVHRKHGSPTVGKKSPPTVYQKLPSPTVGKNSSPNLIGKKSSTVYRTSPSPSVNGKKSSPTVYQKQSSTRNSPQQSSTVVGKNFSPTVHPENTSLTVMGKKSTPTVYQKTSSPGNSPSPTVYQKQPSPNAYRRQPPTTVYRKQPSFRAPRGPRIKESLSCSSSSLTNMVLTKPPSEALQC